MMIFQRSTLTPESRVASSLEPRAKVYLPRIVLLRRIQAMAAPPSITHTMLGMPTIGLDMKKPWNAGCWSK